MDEVIYKIIFVVFIILIALIRLPNRLKYKNVEKIFSKRAKNEKLLVVLAFCGMLGFPFVYILTRWLDYFRMNLPDWSRLSGLLISFLGLIFLWWVHKTLGRNWSPLAEIIKEHQLVYKGPYNYIRHPMYTAFYILSIGLWLFLSNWFIGLFSFLSWHLLCVARIETEEEMLFKRFGQAYKEYLARTGSLLPRFKK